MPWGDGQNLSRRCGIMSKRKIKARRIPVIKCEGCNMLVHPQRVMLVDPSLINVDREPLYLCGMCRKALAWRKVERDGDRQA